MHVVVDRNPLDVKVHIVDVAVIEARDFHAQKIAYRDLQCEELAFGAPDICETVRASPKALLILPIRKEMLCVRIALVNVGR